MGNVAIPALTQKTFEAEGEILENVLTNPFGFGTRRAKVCVLRYAAGCRGSSIPQFGLLPK